MSILTITMRKGVSKIFIPEELEVIDSYHNRDFDNIYFILESKLNTKEELNEQN